MELSVAQPGRGEGPGNGEHGDSSLVIERTGPGGHSVRALWNIAGFGSSNKQKMLYSKYFEVGGYDCRLLVYPTGDAQALPGYMSVYLQISDPGSSSSKWDCFASYRLAVRNVADDAKSVRRDSWHRFSAKKRSHGWCDFAALSSVLDPKQGFLRPGDVVQVSTDITILNEGVTFTRASDLGGGAPTTSGEVYSGNFVWKVQNFSAFQPLLRTQKIMSPAFPAGECALRMSVYQSSVGGTEFLSVCLESKDTERSSPPERTCWCLFRLSVVPQGEGDSRAVHRDSYGRFAADSRGGDNTSLGWNDFMRMDDFSAEGGAYLVDDTAVFSTSFHVIREGTSLARHVEPRGAGALVGAGAPPRGRDKRKSAQRESDCAGRFTWRVENFTRLKDLLKKRRITGLCIKSRRFAVGGRDCRLIVYPRGQSQPPTFLSLFLEVTDPRAASPDWTCFVSHRLSVVNQRGEGDRSVAKESQNRYSRSAKDWGWREFVSLTTLFDADAGFLVDDAVVFSAEVLVLKEAAEVRRLPSPAAPLALPAPPAAAAAPAAPADGGADGAAAPADGAEGAAPAADAATAALDAAIAAAAAAAPPAEAPPAKTAFTWRIENFLAFKEVVETRKIFSRFFPAGPCDLRIGLYESFDSLCLYLESDGAVAPPAAPAPGANGAPPPPPDRPPTHWVRYRAAVLNQRHPERTQWKEGTMLTRSWNNSVLQFARLPAAGAPDADGGLVLKDSLALGCEVLECKPWTDADAEAAAHAAGAAAPAAAAAAGRVDNARGGGGAAAGRLRIPGSESSSDVDGAGEDDDSDAYDAASDAEAEAEVEDALGRWLSSAGLELLGIDNHPPLLGDAAAVQRALESTLLRQPGSVPMFVASLRMYMSSLPRVKRLLLPCLTTVPATPDTIYGIAPAVMSILMGLPSLRQPLMAMLVDVMLDHCLTARMHQHRQQQQQAAAAEVAEASTVDEAAAPAAGADGRRSATGEGPAGDADADADASSGGGAAPGEGGSDSEDAASSAPASSAPASPERAPASQHSSRISGTLADETLSDVEQAVGLVLGWMLSLDPALLQPLPAKPGGHANGRANAPLSSLQKVAMLLADAPRPLQPDIVALVPRLVDPCEHTAAAGALLGRLAEASREGADAEAVLRLPVLAALGTLQIDPGVAEKVLHAALEALPSLSEAELPPAVGLVLKLASGSKAVRSAAVAAVRERVRGGGDGGAGPPPGALDALRLALVQHSEVAATILEAIAAECRAARAAAAAPPADGGGAAPPAPPLCRADLEVVLDCLALPALQEAAVAAVIGCVAAGSVTEAALLPAVAGRQAAALRAVAPREAPPPAAADAAEPGAPPALDASGPTTQPLASPAQRAFVAAHPLAHPSGEGVMPLMLAQQLRLHFPANVPPAGLPALAAPASSDELGGLLAAAEALLLTKGPRQKPLAVALYRQVYRLYDDPASRQRILRGLAQRAVAAGSPLEQLLAGPPGAAAAAAATSAPGTPQPGSPAAGGAAPAVDGLTPAPAVAAELLASLAESSPGSGRLALGVALDAAAAAGAAAEQAQRDTAAAGARHSQDLAAERATVAAAEAGQARAEQRAAELEAQLARARAEHEAQLASAASGRKDHAATARSLEQAVEWVKAERDEERAGRARDAREAAQRLSESEAQLTRLKAARREEQKRQQKERGTATDRARELEEGMTRADAEVARARAEAALATSRADKGTAEARRRAEGAERAAAEAAAEAASLRAAAAERDAQLRAAYDAARDLERRLSAAQARATTLSTGAGLEGAAVGELEAVARLHEQGLQRANALLLQRGRAAVGAPATPAASPAAASPLGKGGFRQQAQQAQQGQQPQRHQSSSGLLPSLTLSGSLDGLPSLQPLTTSASGSLFAGGGWGLPSGGGLAGQSSAPALDPGAAGADAANMEKLLGLLPSDLLHS